MDQGCRVAAAMVAVALSSSPAFGDDPRGLPAPAYSSVDANNVDVGSGRFLAPYAGPAIARSSDLRLDYDLKYLLEVSADNRRAYVEVNTSSPIPQATGYSVITPENNAQFQVLARGNSIIPWHVRGGEKFEFLYQLPVFTERDGTVYYFADFGSTPGLPSRWYVSRIVKPSGEIQTYSYIPSAPNEPRLSSVLSTSGYMLKEQADIRTTTVLNRAIDYCDPSGIACMYSRPWPFLAVQSGYLIDNLGRRTRVGQSNTSGTLTTPEGEVSGGRTVSVTYGTGDSSDSNWYYLRAGRVVSLTDGRGTWRYAYKVPTYRRPDNPLVGYPDLKRVYTTRTDPDGHTVEYVTFFGALASLHDEIGRQTSLTVVIREPEGSDPYEGRTTAVVTPENGRIDYKYDDRGNLIEVKTTPKPGSNLAVTTRTASYPASCDNPRTCNQPDYAIDENASRTDYAYAGWGGIASELGPVVGGTRPLRMWRYVQAYAYVKNASGAIVPAEAPIWRLSRTIVCRQGWNGTATACASPADEIVTDYEYGPPGSANALLVHARIDDATGTPRRTCFAYNDVGDVIAETRPRAGLSTCR